MRGYRVSQAKATEAAHKDIEVWISPRWGYYIRSDNANVSPFVVLRNRETNIPKDAFKAIIGTHIDPLEMSIAELSEVMNLSYNSLVKAAREGRIEARQTGSIWLSTERAVNEAIEAGTIRPRT